MSSSGSSEWRVRECRDDVSRGKIFLEEGKRCSKQRRVIVNVGGNISRRKGVVWRGARGVRHVGMQHDGGDGGLIQLCTL